MLSWILSEESGPEVLAALSGAELVVTSDLTILECERVLLRSLEAGLIPEAEAARRQAILQRASSHWAVLSISQEVLERARRPFPCEPLRTLDAIHLASALSARSMLPDLALLSLDHRLRRSGHAMGFDLVPPATGEWSVGEPAPRRTARPSRRNGRRGVPSGPRRAAPRSR